MHEMACFGVGKPALEINFLIARKLYQFLPITRVRSRAPTVETTEVAMICVFDVIDGPARGKRFWMRSHQRMAVGRISTADFAVVADSHMSRHHLVLEANCEVLRLRDVGSANGTFVNETRINALELRAGDQIRAGSTVFELSILADHEDPHSKDGLTVCDLGDRTIQRTFQ